MGDPSDPVGRDTITTDLVEYFVVVVPDRSSLDAVVAALGDLVGSNAIRILDMVVVAALANNAVEVIEIEAADYLVDLREPNGHLGSLLSRHDLELVALALDPGTTAIVLVAEDRWAEPLSAAARAVGGEVRAGERIGRARVEAALGRLTKDGGTQ